MNVERGKNAAKLHVGKHFPNGTNNVWNHPNHSTNGNVNQILFSSLCVRLGTTFFFCEQTKCLRFNLCEWYTNDLHQSVRDCNGLLHTEAVGFPTETFCPIPIVRVPPMSCFGFGTGNVPFHPWTNMPFGKMNPTVLHKICQCFIQFANKQHSTTPVPTWQSSWRACHSWFWTLKGRYLPYSHIFFVLFLSPMKLRWKAMASNGTTHETGQIWSGAGKTQDFGLLWTIFKLFIWPVFSSGRTHAQRWMHPCELHGWGTGTIQLSRSWENGTVFFSSPGDWSQQQVQLPQIRAGSTTWFVALASTKWHETW